MATAKKLPSGRWRIKVYVGRDSKGKILFESFTADTKKQAERDAAIFAMQLKRRKKSPLTLGEAMDAFIQTCRVQQYSPSTIRDYVSRRNSSYPNIIDCKIDEITTADVQACVDAKSKTASVKTVKNDYFLLKTVLQKNGTKVDFDQIVIAHRKKRKKHTMQESWAFDVLTYAKEHFEADFYLYCCFIISAGLRSSEISALTWADISAEPTTTINGRRIGTINVQKARVRGEHGFEDKGTKTESGVRQLVLDWSFFENLYSLKQRGKDNEKIFAMSSSKVTYRWALQRKAMGLPQEIRFYDLRHYYATSLVYAGASEEELASAMGHSTSTFSHSVYVQLFKERQQTVNDKLATITSTLYSTINAPKQANSDNCFHESFHENKKVQ